ncbi:MAG: glycosyltransferase [Actinomycetota bacterium]
MRVLHVRLDEPGGGVVYVRAALELDDPTWEMEEIALDPRRLKSSLVGWWRSVVGVRKAVRRRGIDIVHAHGVRAGLVALLGSFRLRRRRVLLIHGLHSMRRASARSLVLVRFVNRRILRSFDRVMVLSNSDRDAIVGSRLAPAGRVRLVRTTIRPPKPAPRDEARDVFGLAIERPVLLWLGRFSAEKDPLTFVRAVNDLSGDVAGLMIGDGELLEEARSIAGPSVIIAGWLDDPSAGFAAADIFVNSSEWEGLPIAVLEAASGGVRLVLSDRPGNRDVVAMGVPARSFVFGDSDALSIAIKEELAHPVAEKADVRKMVLATFNPEALREDLLAVYTELART